MRNYICGSLLALLICGNVFAADISIQKVEISPLSGGISFNTVASNPGWTLATFMTGRKEVLLTNTSTTTDIYLTGVSGSSVTGTLYPRESITIKASSSMNIYVKSSAPTSVEVWEIR